MANEGFYDDEEFIIYLTIDGTEYEEVEVLVTNPNKTIKDQIDKIVQVFEMPKLDNQGAPIEYKLGKAIDGDEPQILDPVDENGNEQCLLDYNVQPDDHLHLFYCPIAYACPIPIEMIKQAE